MRTVITICSGIHSYGTRRIERVCYGAGLWSVALTGLGLYLFAREQMSPSLGVAVMWHLAAGTVLSVLYVWRMIRRPEPTRRLYPLLGLVCAVTGIGLMVYAALGGSVGRTRALFLTHVITGCAVAAWAAWRAYRRWKQHRRHIVLTSAHVQVSSWVAVFLLVASAGAFAAYTYAAETYYRTLTATNAAQADNPLFPAGTRLAPDGDWERAPQPAECGEAGCHPDIWRQWKHSAHANAEEKPLYRRGLQETTRTLGPEGARWCRGCHAPLTLARGYRKTPQTGVDCLSCHAMVQVPEPTGNGRSVYQAPPVYPFAQDTRPLPRWLHGFLLRVRPQPHRAALTGPRRHSVDVPMCIPCHRLSITPVQNRYKFIRYDDTWADWQAGAYSGESLYTWGAVERPKSCVDCHFPAARGWDISGRTHKHDSPLHNPQKPALRVHIFALRRGGDAPMQPEQLDAPLEGRTIAVTPGETLRVDVLVENVGIGHAFPTGAPDLHKAWMSFWVIDAHGRVQLKSGFSEKHAQAHRYGLFALDRRGKPLGQGDLFNLVLPIPLSTIAAGAVDVVRYRFKVPAHTGGAIRLTARLHSHSLRQAIHTLTLHVREAGGPNAVAMPPARTRADDVRAAEGFYRYGIGLLLQSDYQRARRAFRQAAALVPRRADIWIALGRVYLAEGDLLAARAQFQQALQLEPNNARAQAWLGYNYRLMGQFEDALKLLLPLAPKYPRDRRLWFHIGRSYFQNGQYEQAAYAFTQMLNVDPDDATAHFNLMSCFRRLRRISAARREEAIFRSLQEEEPPTSILEPFLAAHPEIRRETQPQHEHLLQGQ